MRRILFAVGWICLGLASLAAETNTPAPAVPLEKLIEQLGDANFRNRESASKAIEARGIAILPQLRTAAEATPSAEARRRLQALLVQMERAAVLEPKWVTLKCKGKSITDVVADLSKQTGYQINYQGGGNAAALTIDMEHATFWQVMDKICNDSQLYVYHNENNGMQLYHQDQYFPHVAYSGPFKLTANNLHFSKSINLGGMPRNPASNQGRSESLQFMFNIMSEPKLPIMSVGQARVVEAADEHGNSMTLPANPHETYYHNGGYKTYNHSLAVQMTWPNKEAKLVKRLRVAVPLTLLASQKPDIVVDDVLKVAKDKKFVGNSAEITVMEAKDINNKTQYQLKLNVRNTASNAAQDYNWGNSLTQRLELYDAKGNKYYPQGQNWESNSPGQMQATFMFGNNGVATLGPPAKLVYLQWGLMQHQIEVEFKDLPLP